MSEIDSYLDGLNMGQKNELLRIRKIVKSIVPDVEEVISYGMPVFKCKGKYLIGMSAFKNHLSVFPGSDPVEALKSELSEYKTSKGTIQFTLEKPLTDDLLKAVINESLKHI